MHHDASRLLNHEDVMTPPRAPKLSGAELAAQLAGTSFPQAETPGPATPAPASAPPSQPEAKRTPGKGGRPSKGGGPDAIPVNLRLSPADQAALAKIAYELMTPGRPPLTVQDVLRRLVRGAINDPDTLNRLVKEGEL
jgi:hypothetical protein